MKGRFEALNDEDCPATLQDKSEDRAPTWSRREAIM